MDGVAVAVAGKLGLGGGAGRPSRAPKATDLGGARPPEPVRGSEAGCSGWTRGDGGSVVDDDVLLQCWSAAARGHASLLRLLPFAWSIADIYGRLDTSDDDATETRGGEDRGPVAYGDQAKRPGERTTVATVAQQDLPGKR